MRSVWNNLRLLTRSDLVIVAWENAPGSGLYFPEREHSYVLGGGSISGGLKLPLGLNVF